MMNKDNKDLDIPSNFGLVTGMIGISLMALIGKELSKMFGEKGLDIKDIMEGIVRGIISETRVQLDLKQDEIDRLKKEVSSVRCSEIEYKKKYDELQKKYDELLAKGSKK